MPLAVPLATYRLQLTKNFTFDDAAKLVPYLQKLGVSHLYASPFLKARPGSTHGYDIVEHDKLNPELGGEEAFLRLSDALKAAGLGLILDFVPNHMGVGHADNPWWLDVLEWGQKSPHAPSFDIDWDGLPYRRHPGVLLPILGRPYGDALQAGEIDLKYDAASGSFAFWYFDHKLPVNPQRYSEMLRTIVGAAAATDDPAGHELITLAHDYRDPTKPAYRDAPALKERLAAIKGAAAVIERGLGTYRGDGDGGAGALHRLLERQHYRLAYWRVAFSAVNYRRFFDISDLAGIRPEDPGTFRAMHTLVSRLITEDRLQGLRLDHIDGLRDPAQYTRRLAAHVRKLRREAGLSPDFYVIVEKILEADESMPPLPGVAGTTGYEWLNGISRTLVDGGGMAALDEIWRGFTGERAELSAMLQAAKQRVIDTMLASEFTVLTRALSRIAAGYYSTRDFTVDRLRAALQLYVVEFPVYRTYVTAAGASVTDRTFIQETITRARARWNAPDPNIFDFLRDAITLDLAAVPGTSASRVRNFALKLQQFTGPLMAKALEDTTFYRHHRLLALNEVGGDPDAPALSLTEFHRIQAARADAAPAGLTATATHDTKRGEDARARILALSELADDWRVAVNDWARINAPLAEGDGGDRRPTRAHEYMLYQALIGAWEGRADEDFRKRMQAYALKAAREGKDKTSWTNPHLDYEDSLERFVQRLLDPVVSAEFLASFGAFSQRTALLGALNGLSQLALKSVLPGVPDFYQGTERWDFSLVDPDNRRPVDFAARERMQAAGQVPWPDLAADWRDGRIKQALTHEFLELRQRHPDVFQRGACAAVDVSGEHAAHVVAVARTTRQQEVVIAVGRHFARVTDGGRRWPSDWRATIILPQGARYRDALQTTDVTFAGRAELSALFSTMPITVLLRV
ncbi:MAG TPA: malto-oligosyltrehalose synthase [Pseudolabrys sp.]|nr:malto-oligosyltrehalose synthase [Pseudolabrys sp.]